MNLTGFEVPRIEPAPVHASGAIREDSKND